MSENLTWHSKMQERKKQQNKTTPKRGAEREQCLCLLHMPENTSIFHTQLQAGVPWSVLGGSIYLFGSWDMSEGGGVEIEDEARHP